MLPREMLRGLLPQIILASTFCGLSAAHGHHQSLRLQGNLRARYPHDVSEDVSWQKFKSSLWGQTHSKMPSFVMPANKPGKDEAAHNEAAEKNNCFNPLLSGTCHTYHPGHNDISFRLGGRVLVNSIEHCRQLCLEYTCGSLEVNRQQNTPHWACWLSSTRANTFMGGTLEKKEGWSYQEVKYGCKAAASAAITTVTVTTTKAGGFDTDGAAHKAATTSGQAARRDLGGRARRGESGESSEPDAAGKKKRLFCEGR